MSKGRGEPRQSLGKQHQPDLRDLRHRTPGGPRACIEDFTARRFCATTYDMRGCPRP